MRAERLWLILLGWSVAAFSPTAAAEPIFPTGRYPALESQMARHARQFYLFNARPFGLSLDAHYPDDQARSLVETFLAQDESDDVEAVLGQHPYSFLASYGEFGDLGFFGGVALAGLAFEYQALKREGASADRLALARQRLVRAAESWHVFYRIAGADGVVARGIRRLVPEDPGAPPLPGSAPETLPLFDEHGDPFPLPKTNGSWRADNSGGELPEGTWIWEDSCSKDQMVGQVFGMVVLHDAMAGDPDIDPQHVARMREDALGVARMLMTRRDISLLQDIDGDPLGEGEYDLIIMDADGRPTMYHDLNPKSFEKFYFPEDSASFNRFNVIMAVGVMKGLFHITGDEEIERYVYDELMHEREYLDLLFRSEGAIDYIYMGRGTHWDDPDMTAVALWLALYTEKDPEVRAPLLRFLEQSWWAPESEPDYAASKAKQPLWHLVYLSMTESAPGQSLADEAADLLEGFALGPYFNDEVTNCDAQELEARECLAIDGQTVLHLVGIGERDGEMASEALHPRIRPPSNFNARSNPFAVNGGGGRRLNPGGDLLAAWWMGRSFESAASGATRISPQARDHMPVGGWPDGGLPSDGGQDPQDPGDGCGCGSAGAGSLVWIWLALVGCLLRLRSSLRSSGGIKPGASALSRIHIGEPWR
ncbi:MAG: hypothetical protein JXR96_22395 [Deltaproteobacteria bacterium]|nr:hypothetical protein [Deltaproteobacteria bacterium]